MADSLSPTRLPDPLRLPDTFGATALRVGIESEGIGIGSVVFDALVRHFGTVKALAYELGSVDPSQARAEIKAGDFRRLDKYLKPKDRPVVADAVQSAYGRQRGADDDADAAVAQLFVIAQRLAAYVAFRRSA